MRDTFTDYLHHRVEFVDRAPKVTIIEGDITEIEVDAIVNAANPTLMGGGGVDGAIHGKAGLSLKKECLEIRNEHYRGGLPTGKAVITKGYDSKAKFIIHPVGPFYKQDNLFLLKDCYLNSLKLAEQNFCNTIAFPSISTGIYGVPIEEAVKIVKSTLENYKSNVIKEIILVLHNDYDWKIYVDCFK